MKIRIICPACETPGPTLDPGAASWQCLACDHIVSVASPSPDPALPSCAVCGCADLYRKKDFPHTLGMTILLGALVGSTITYWLYDWWWTWAILIGSAAFDGILYLLVKDVVVCHRCDGEHRGVLVDPERHLPFELTTYERYRQEKLRKEAVRVQLLSQGKSPR